MLPEFFQGFLELGEKTDTEFDEIIVKKHLTMSVINFRGRLMLSHLIVSKIRQLKGQSCKQLLVTTTCSQCHF